MSDDPTTATLSAADRLEMLAHAWARGEDYLGSALALGYGAGEAGAFRRDRGFMAEVAAIRAMLADAALGRYLDQAPATIDHLSTIARGEGEHKPTVAEMIRVGLGLLANTEKLLNASAKRDAAPKAPEKAGAAPGPVEPPPITRRAAATMRAIAEALGDPDPAPAAEPEGDDQARARPEAHGRIAAKLREMGWEPDRPGESPLRGPHARTIADPARTPAAAAIPNPHPRK